MPLPELFPVYSSHVVAVGWADFNLYVQWDSGKISEYAGVPERLADTVRKSWSVGEAIARDIKNKFPHRYVTE